jgi:hypothetical protein
MNSAAPEQQNSSAEKTTQFKLFWLSFVLMFAEVMALRWIGIEMPVVRAFPNLVIMVALIAASTGLASSARQSAKPNWLNSNIFALSCSIVLILTLIYAVRLNFAQLSIKVGPEQGDVFTPIAILLGIVFCLYAIFRKIGTLLAPEFDALEPLTAYSTNLLGSMLGVATFALCSKLCLGPTIWCLVLGGACFTLARKTYIPVIAITIAALAYGENHTSLWSPYSKLDIIPMAHETAGVLGEGNYILNSNNSYFHFALRILSPAAEKSYLANSTLFTQQAKTVKYYLKWLGIPVSFANNLSDVLVLGAGSGNDVAYALAHHAGHVTAVEIDPIIVGFGSSIHPNKPFLDRRVTVINDDARSFLRRSTDKFDLIEFAYLDPGATVRIASFLRVDNYVYTVESMSAALDRLKPNGIVTVAFATGANNGISNRLYKLIEQAAGYPPLAFEGKDWDSVLYIFGPGAAKIDANAVLMNNKNLGRWPAPGTTVNARPSTDQWPFLYTEFDSRGIWLYVLILIVTVVLPSLLLIGVRRENASWGDWANMFFLGQAFMLIETKAITELSLLFGATWLVSSVVISTVLLLAWIANLAVRKIAGIKLSVVYALLVVCIAADYAFVVPSVSSMPSWMIAVFASLVTCLPIIFGSMIFSLRFKEATSPAILLSANLLGVAFGGLTENMCLLVGTKGLSLVALLLYTLSLLSLILAERVRGRAKAPD